MEPMTLGSPINSPVSTPLLSQNTSYGSHGSKPPGGYYPSFLLGDGHPSTKATPGGMSPGRPPKKLSLGGSHHTASPQPLRGDVFMYNKHERMRGLVGDRPVGPPSAGLVGGLASPQPRTPGAPFLEHSKLTGIQNMSGIQSPGLGSPYQPGTPYTPSRDITARSDIILETTSENLLIEPWVTVFGFPISSSNYILAQFAQFGVIIDQRLHGGGNWMHLKYQTRAQARKALSKNGRVFGGDLMVGVVLCTDETLVGNKESSILNDSSIYIPADSSTVQTPKSQIRPLTQAYRVSRAENEVAPTISTPKKDDGLLSKTMQTLFGI